MTFLTFCVSLHTVILTQTDPKYIWTHMDTQKPKTACFLYPLCWAQNAPAAVTATPGLWQIMACCPSQWDPRCVAHWLIILGIPMPSWRFFNAPWTSRRNPCPEHDDCLLEIHQHLRFSPQLLMPPPIGEQRNSRSRSQRRIEINARRGSGGGTQPSMLALAWRKEWGVPVKEGEWEKKRKKK